MVAGRWWLVVGGWSLVVGGWWLVVGILSFDLRPSSFVLRPPSSVVPLGDLPNILLSLYLVISCPFLCQARGCLGLQPRLQENAL